MNLLVGCFGIFAVFLGAGATYIALKDGEIAAIPTARYRPESSRKETPFLFWSGIVGYALIMLIGIIAIVGATLGS